MACNLTKRARTGGSPLKGEHPLNYHVGSRGTDNVSRQIVVQEGIFNVRELKSGPAHTRHTNDEIHSTIDFCPVVSVIVDTPVFQRLRDLKQLGSSHFVYCNANHSRFEHSLGVAHLAEKLVKRIRKNQKFIFETTTEKDVLCAKLAGLFHDIGHGPFSHVYEDFVNTVFPAYLLKQPCHIQEKYKLLGIPSERSKHWKHEICSLQMIDLCLAHLGLQIDKDHLDDPLQQIGDGIDALSMRCFDGNWNDTEMILTSRDWIFIKECIWGGPLDEFKVLVGRPDRIHEWLYDVISNSHSGLDVDKMDYFARDSRRAFRDSGEIDYLFIKEAAVAWGKCTRTPGTCTCHEEDFHSYHHLMICYPDKMVDAALSFFSRRFDLHEKIYQHKTTLAAALMICDIFCKADPFFPVPFESDLKYTMDRMPSFKSEGFQYLTLSTAMFNPNAYMKLRDSVIDVIEFSINHELKDARDLILRLRSRDFYKEVSRKKIDSENKAHQNLWQKTESEIKEELLNFRNNDLRLIDEDIIIKKGEIHYGLREKNPLLNMRFFKKTQKELLVLRIKDLPVATCVLEGQHRAKIPTSFVQKYISVISRDSTKSEDLKQCFEQWWLNNSVECVSYKSECFCVNVEERTNSDCSFQIPLCTQDSEDDYDCHRTTE